MTDIVTSLRAHRSSAYMCQDCYGTVMDEAADEIEHLRLTLAELLVDVDDVADGKLPEISAATLTRARQRVGCVAGTRRTPMNFVGIKVKIDSQRRAGDPAACLDFEEVEGLLDLAKETWELRRTLSEREAKAKVEGYRDGQQSVVSRLRANGVTLNLDS